MKKEKFPLRGLKDRLRLVLVRTRNPLNIGAAARAMSNFGFSHLRVVKPYEPAFRGARSAVGATEVLANAEQFGSVADAVADCALVIGTTAARRREILHVLENLETGAPLIRAGMSSGPVALLFGSEKTGLSKQDFSHCHWLMHISTASRQPSMNLGQAVAVCLYEIARETEVVSAGPPLAAASDLERITSLLYESLAASGYVRSGAERTTKEKLRRMVRILNITAEDAETWMGMLRQIAWKLTRV
jgi:TrmH family RNA methyltransferase